MVSVTRRGSTFKALAAIAVAALALGLGSSARAQIHGVQIGKSCDSPRCVLDKTDCIILIGHADGFDDTIQINEAVDIIIQPIPGPADDIRVPAVGNLPIVGIEGNAFCSGVGCDQSTGTGCTLPCRVGPPLSTLSGLPGDLLSGTILFRSNTYIIQPDDPMPLQDQATVEVQDLCDEPTTSGCSGVPNDVQFTASTVWCDADDDDECTTDACVDGTCTNVPITCDDDSLCTNDACNPANGQCVFTPNIVCDDGSLCTTDTCNPATGQCVFTPNIVCNDNSLCTNDACNPATGQCVFTPNIVCNDNSLCTNDTCNPATGQCVFTPNIVCNDNNLCTADSCNPATGQCVFTPNVPCNDSNLCTADSCNPATGTCIFTPNVVCDDSSLCTTDSCNPSSGQCIFTPNIVCNDNNLCTNDTCNPGTGLCVFTPTPQSNCNDNNLCTDDACVPATGQCSFTPNIDCDDGNACTTESCSPATGLCVTTDTRVCDDNNLCTDDSCNPTTGQCVFTPTPQSVCPPPGGSCEFSQCNPATGLCETSGVNCNDGDECTEDICDSIAGCRFEPIACCESDCEPITKAHFDIWNENERKLSGTYRCIASWDQELLSRYTPGGLANNLLRPNLQTDKGKARIDGLRSQQCEENCFRDPKTGEPLPIEDIIDLFGEEVDVVCSEDNPLLGVAAKVLTFPGAGTARAGSELVGMGHQAGQIAYDLLGGSPPTAAAGVVTPDDFVKSIRSTARGGSSTLLMPEQSTGPAAGLDDPPIPVGIGRGSTTQKGSLVVYTKVEIKWDAAGNVIQDTFLTLTNDHFEEVTVQLYFVHGDLCTWVDNAFILTPNQSVYWSVLTGQPIGASPFTVLEERCPDDDPENPGGTRMRGYVLAWAVDPTTNQEIRFNHLSGTGMLVNYRDVTAWEYNAWAFQATEAVAHGAILFPPYGRLDVNGVEYQSAPDQLLLDFFASGAMINPGGIGTVSIDTDLTLWIFDADLRENTGAPFEPNDP